MKWWERLIVVLVLGGIFLAAVALLLALGPISRLGQ